MVNGGHIQRAPSAIKFPRPARLLTGHRRNSCQNTGGQREGNDMSRFAAPAVLALAALAFGLAIVPSAPVFAEPYPRETVECAKGLVYDRKTKRCVRPQPGVTLANVLADRL
jgi:hypothetical protein